MRPRCRRLSLVASLAIWLALFLLAWLGRSSGTIHTADIFGLGLTSIFSSFLSRLFGSRSASSGAAVGMAILNLEEGLTDVTDKQRTFIDRLGGWLKPFVGVFSWFKNNALVPLLRWLRERIVWLKDWLRRFLGPVIDVIRKVRAELLKIYAKFVRPVLDTIAAIRAILQLLSKFGVEWAGELDRKLALITREIKDRWEQALFYVNGAYDLIYGIIDFDRSLLRIPLFRALVRDARYLNQLFWHIQLDALPDDRLPPAADELTRRKPSQEVGEVKEFLLRGTGPGAAQKRELRAIALAAAEGRELPVRR